MFISFLLELTLFEVLLSGYTSLYLDIHLSLITRLHNSFDTLIFVAWQYHPMHSNTEVYLDHKSLLLGNKTMDFKQ